MIRAILVMIGLNIPLFGVAADLTIQFQLAEPVPYSVKTVPDEKKLIVTLQDERGLPNSAYARIKGAFETVPILRKYAGQSAWQLIADLPEHVGHAIRLTSPRDAQAFIQSL